MSRRGQNIDVVGNWKWFVCKVVRDEPIAVANVVTNYVQGVEEEIVVADMVGMAMRAHQVPNFRPADVVGFKG